jgi:hypothetical protein
MGEVICTPPGGGESIESEGETEMEHFTTEQWIDFVNQVVPHPKQVAMRKHLGSGCKRCAEKLALWQKVRNTAASEANFQPPVEAVRVAKAMFAAAGIARQPERTRSLVEVLFDSFLQPALTGARSTAMGPRQMLYRADSYQIDIQIEAQSAGNVLVVTGQLMDVSTPEMVSRGARVTLSDRRGNVTEMVTNQFGEFRGEIADSGDLELSIFGQGEQPITISLRHALGRLLGDKA